MTPSGTLWPLESHTIGKHLVLKNYLNAWFPIISKYNKRILFIDGFAGPGQYEGGEEGSPLIALNSFCEHRARSRINSEVVFVFIEKDRSRANHLNGIIDPIRQNLPENCVIQVINNKFDGHINEIMDILDEQAHTLAPSFVMVDPFGVSETPMEVIGRILRNEKSEVYISFMYDYINRFRSNPEFEPHLDELFGCSDWRDGRAIENSIERKHFYYNLYDNQLRKAGAEYVINFELYEGDRLVYSIFFGTKHPLGCDRMKQSIWKVAPFGDFSFRSVRAHQLTLGLEEPDFEPLKNLLINRFREQDWIGIEEINEYVSSDETDYHSGQYKQVLKELEQNNQIEADANTRKRRFTYPNGARLRII